MDQEQIVKNRAVICALKKGHNFISEDILFNNSTLYDNAIIFRRICINCGKYYTVNKVEGNRSRLYDGPEGRMFKYWREQKLHQQG